MRCPQCGRDQSADAKICQCGYAFADAQTLSADEQPTTGHSHASLLQPGIDQPPSSLLVPGQVFDRRYRVIRLLGVGGMGAVYQAWDDQLGVSVAIKIIRTELAADASTAGDLERRFKRELLLARQITHKNVVRIHDLGEVGGITYLTMPFVQGTDLAKVLRRDGRLPVDRALALFRQIVAGLAAAHEAGVVHRDLKPANIMIDESGQVQIMDFGIARSSGPDVTASVELIGTVEYMAPEQLNGEQADQRSDIYALGLIFYEMLAGRQASAIVGGTSLGGLLSRRQQRPVPMRSLGLPIPEAVDDIALRCLDPDAAQRFQSVRELETELSRLDTDGHLLLGMTMTGVRPAIAVVVPRRRLRGAWRAAGAAAATIAALAAIGWLAYRPRQTASTSTAAPITVLIAEFDNRSGDPVFDGVVEQALGVVLEGAPFITVYPRRDAIRVAGEVRSEKKVDESVARLIALREGIQVVVPGAIARTDGRYELSARAVDAVSGKVIASATVQANGKDQVLEAVGKLGARVRTSLGDVTPESTQTAAAETFTAASLEAAHTYAAAQEANFAGKSAEAIASYQEAIALDPDLGRAYAGLANAYANLGRQAEAERNYSLALTRIDRMTERERFRTRGAYYLFRRNGQKALEEFSGLVKAYPSDTAAPANFALAYFYMRDMAKALDEGRRAAVLYPKNVIRRNNVALYAMYAGDFVTAQREAAGVLQLNPVFEKALIATALSQLAQGRHDQALASYQKLAGSSQAGASYAATGLADLAMYDGRPGDAKEALQQGIARDEEAKNPGAAALKEVMLASVQHATGQTADAIRSIEAALGRSHDTAVVFLAGHLDVDMGRRDRALALASELEQSVDADPRAYGLLLRGEVALAGNDARAALDLFAEARMRADTWFGRFDVGRANLKLDRPAEASSEFEICLKRRGEVTALFLDEIPTFRFFPPVYYYLGLVQEGLKSPAAGDSYRTFLTMKEKADPAADPLVHDARARLAR
jgi:tetratricopeptide (TPR) repeat protein